MPIEPSPETEQYRGLVQLIRETTNWKPQFQSKPLEERLERIREGHTVELFFDIPDTNGQVHVRLPGEREGTIGDLLLDIPLSSGLEWTEGGFVGQLCTTHEGIAENHRTKYCTAVADTSLVMRADIPRNYSDETVIDTFRALSKTADEVTALHDDLESVLGKYH